MQQSGFLFFPHRNALVPPVIAIALAVSLLLLRCSAAEESPPCDSDPLQCRDSEETFQVDVACTNNSPLRISVGEGERLLTLFEPGQAPTFHRGAQLGRHVFLGFRLHNPDGDYEGIEADITLRNSDYGITRHIIVDQGFVTNADGSLDVTGYVIIGLGAPAGSEGLLSVSVQDRCGREASIEHPFLY